ncbi:hypothetical protein CsatA_021022 [Cannabis sativa]
MFITQSRKSLKPPLYCRVKTVMKAKMSCTTNFLNSKATENLLPTKTSILFSLSLPKSIVQSLPPTTNKLR